MSLLIMTTFLKCENETPWTKHIHSYLISGHSQVFQRTVSTWTTMFSLTITSSRSNIPYLEKIIWVIGVLRGTVVCNWRFVNLCGSHLQSQVIVIFSWNFKNPGERFDWSIDRVAAGKRVKWLAVKTSTDIGYTNRWVVRWIINNELLSPVE